MRSKHLDEPGQAGGSAERPLARWALGWTADMRAEPVRSRSQISGFAPGVCCHAHGGSNQLKSAVNTLEPIDLLWIVLIVGITNVHDGVVRLVMVMADY